MRSRRCVHRVPAATGKMAALTSLTQVKMHQILNHTAETRVITLVTNEYGFSSIYSFYGNIRQ